MKIELRKDNSLILLWESDFEQSVLETIFTEKQGTKEYFYKSNIEDTYGVVIK